MGKDYSKNHIVPKCYLDRFAEPGRSEYIIGTRLNKDGELKFYKQATDNVGYINDFYDVDDKDDTKYWEHYFAGTQDSLCGAPLGRIVAAATMAQPDTRILNDQEKDVLARIIMSQLLRVPSSINHTKTLYPAVSKSIKAITRSALPLAARSKFEKASRRAELTDKELMQLHLNSCFDSELFERYCSILKDRLWLVAINTQRSNMPFVTSDHPVLVEGFFSRQKGLYDNGIATALTGIFFPISPSVAILNYSCDGLIFLADKQIDRNDDGYSDIVAAIYEMLDGRITLLDDIPFIVEKNVAIMEQAHMFSFITQPLYDDSLSMDNE